MTTYQSASSLGQVSAVQTREIDSANHRLSAILERIENMLKQVDSFNGRAFGHPPVGPREGKERPSPSGAIFEMKERLDDIESMCGMLEASVASLDKIL